MVNVIIRGALATMLFLGSALPVVAAVPDLERQALIDLYSTTGGEAWSRADGWLGLMWSILLLNERALDALAAGEPSRAEEFLLASWRLRESHARRHGSPRSQLLGNILAREQLVILRRLENPSPAWISRLERQAPLTNEATGSSSVRWTTSAAARRSIPETS